MKCVYENLRLLFYSVNEGKGWHPPMWSILTTSLRDGLYWCALLQPYRDENRIKRLGGGVSCSFERVVERIREWSLRVRERVSPSPFREIHSAMDTQHPSYLSTVVFGGSNNLASLVKVLVAVSAVGNTAVYVRKFSLA